MERNFKECLNETYDLFKSQGVSILGKGYEEIATDPVLFENYVDSLTEGSEAGSKDQMAQLLTNTNKQILQESVSGIQPIASLAGPMIRKLWPSFALKHAVKTEVATSPSFVIPFMKPYFEKKVGNEMVRTYVFEGVKGAYGIGDGTLAGDYVSKDVTGLTKGSTVSVEMGSEIDADFMLESIKVDGADVLVGKKLGIERVLVHDFDLKAGTGTSAPAAEAGTILIRADLKTGKVLVSMISSATGDSRITGLRVRGHKNTEFNENAVSWGLETGRETIQIGAGEHFNAPVTVETINDLNALYQLDGTKELTDIMTNAFEYRTDFAIFKFLKDSFIHQPKAGEFSSYPTATDYLAVFDVKPAAGFAGGPKAWREELKPVIDHLAARIKNQTHLANGMFNIVGNPLDVQLITNVLEEQKLLNIAYALEQAK